MAIYQKNSTLRGVNKENLKKKVALAGLDLKIGKRHLNSKLPELFCKRHSQHAICC